MKPSKWIIAKLVVDFLSISHWERYVSYLSIRKRLNNRNRYTTTTQNRQIGEKNIKLSKTLFTVVCASIVCLAPSASFYIVSCFHQALLLGFLKYIFTIFNTTQNRQILEQNIKLSKTFFTVICASIVCLAPSVSFYIVSCFHPALFAGFLKYIFVMLNQSNSLVNPIIYSFRMPIFRKTLKQLKNRMKIPRPS